LQHNSYNISHHTLNMWQSSERQS